MADWFDAVVGIDDYRQFALDKMAQHITDYYLGLALGPLQRPKLIKYWEKVKNEVTTNYPGLIRMADQQRLAILNNNAENLFLCGGVMADYACNDFDNRDQTQCQKPGDLYGNWSTFSYDSNWFTFDIDNTEAYAGASLRLQGVTEMSVAQCPTEYLDFNSTYSLSFFYKTTNDIGGVWYRFTQTADGARFIGYLPPAEEWTRYERVFTVTDNLFKENTTVAMKVKPTFVIGLRMGESKKSTLWIDEINLQKMLHQ